MPADCGRWLLSVKTRTQLGKRAMGATERKGKYPLQHGAIIILFVVSVDELGAVTIRFTGARTDAKRYFRVSVEAFNWLASPHYPA